MDRRAVKREHSSGTFPPGGVRFQRDHRQWGEVALLQPPSAKVATWIIAAFAALIVVFLCLAPYARKETVSGYLAAAAGTARIYAPRPGIVSGVHVEEGQEVKEGEPLLSVSTAQVAADGQDVNAAMLDALWRQADLLARQVSRSRKRARGPSGTLGRPDPGLEHEVPASRPRSARSASASSSSRAWSPRPRA